MEGADVSNVNFELTCMKDASLKNAVVNNVCAGSAYIQSTTKLDGINIEGADFTDTELRKDQQRKEKRTGVLHADVLWQVIFARGLLAQTPRLVWTPRTVFGAAC
eukprot:755082-Hanusia_phi.AAC.2